MPTAIYRTAAFLFSIVCYGVFLLVFLYLLAFLGNLQATPRLGPSTWGATWVRWDLRCWWISACYCSSACSIP